MQTFLSAETLILELLLVVIAAVCGWDALSPYVERVPGTLRTVLPAICAMGLIAIYLNVARTAYRNFQQAEPLGLAGATRTRVPPPLAASLRRLTEASRSAPCW